MYDTNDGVVAEDDDDDDSRCFWSKGNAEIPVSHQIVDSSNDAICRNQAMGRCLIGNTMM